MQSTLGPFLTVGRVAPDLILILVIGWAVLNGFWAGLGWAFLGGLALDLFSGAPFGVFTVSLLVTSGLASLAHGRTLGNLLTLPVLLTLPLSLVFNGLALLILALAGRAVDWGLALTVILFPAALFNTGVMLLLFPLIYWLFRLQHRGEIEIA